VIVYVESNFVLEIALEQEQSSAARSIISLAESRQLELVYPSFVLSEPFETIARANRERNDLQASLLKAFSYLKRSEPYKGIMLDSEPVIRVLRDVFGRQKDLLHAAFNQLISTGRCINIDISIFREALVYQRSLELSPQDSIIYSAIVADLKGQAQDEVKCFLSRDRKAFGSDDDRRVKAELGKYNCRYIGNFIQGLDFIQSSLKIG
jgi:predicted nucleic acid-binding protein